MAARNQRAALRHDTTVEDLVRGGLLRRVSGAALVVYLHLVAIARGDRRPMRIKNDDLMPNGATNAATITRALQRLHDAKLVRLRYSVESGTLRRTIEVVA